MEPSSGLWTARSGADTEDNSPGEERTSPRTPGPGRPMKAPIGGSGAGRPRPRARIEPAVEQVHHQIDQGIGDREDEYRREYHREVAVEQRLHGEPSEARPREDGLGDHRAPQELAGVEPGEGHDRDRRVLE